MYYPDAVTLARNCDAGALLERVDASVGSSVRDSFADLDLAPSGFHILFEATWICRPSLPPAPAPAGRRWQRVVDADHLARWEDAWRGPDSPHGLFRVDLLASDDVMVLAAESAGQVVALAILNHSPACVGMSNFFALPGEGPDPWTGCLAAAGSWRPYAPLMAYESAEVLQLAHRQGFRSWARFECGSKTVKIGEEINAADATSR